MLRMFEKTLRFCYLFERFLSVVSATEAVTKISEGRTRNANTRCRRALNDARWPSIKNILRRMYFRVLMSGFV